MQMVGADWIKSDRREDDLASRCGSIVQVWPLILYIFLSLSFFFYFNFFMGIPYTFPMIKS